VLISTVTSVITRVSLTRLGYNVIGEYAKVVCITRNFAYACWIIRDSSDQFEDINVDDGAKCSDLTLFLLLDFL
jgi:hypothetical protein